LQLDLIFISHATHFLLMALLTFIAALLGDLILLSGIFYVETFPYEKNSLVFDYPRSNLTLFFA